MRKRVDWLRKKLWHWRDGRKPRRERERRSKSKMNTVLGIVLVLGVMILVHEWGHFIVARLFGVRVDVFSIGFGPRLFGWKRGATDYRVSAIPLGGYVRMAGQDPSEVDAARDQTPTGAADELM